MSPNSDDNGRRSWGNEARDDFKFKHRHECVLRKSKKISDIDEKTTLDFEVNDIRPPELFDNGKRIVAVGGYIKTDSPVKYEVRLLTNGNEVVAEGNTVSNKWEDIGAHIEIEDNSIPNDGYNVNANLSVESINSELNELQLYGINIEPVTFPYYVKNISYEGRTIGEVFNESVSKAYFPQQLYYLDHSEPLPIKPTDTADNNLEPGSVVVLIRCKRECGRLLPVEYEEEKSGRRFKISFSAHSRPDSGYCNHDQPWNKFPVSLDQSTVYPEDVPNGLDELIRKKESEQIELFDIDKKESHSPGFIFNSHFGFQAGCRACRKYEVNDELNSDRVTAQYNESNNLRKAKGIIAREELGIEDIKDRYSDEYGETFRKHVWKEFDKECFSCKTNLSDPNTEYSSWHLDHTRPISKFYPLDKYATPLCANCNEMKGQRYPVEYYDNDRLEEIAEIVREDSKLESIIGKEEIDLADLKTTEPNIDVLNSLVENPQKLFEDYLKRPVCQKEVRDTLVAEKIKNQINDFLNEVGIETDIEEAYREKTERDPSI